MQGTLKEHVLIPRIFALDDLVPAILRFRFVDGHDLSEEFFVRRGFDHEGRQFYAVELVTE